MSGIKRYESFVAAAYGGPCAAMRPSDSGNWVGFTEHEAEVARLRADLKSAYKAALDAVALSREKEREADALRKDAERYRFLRSQMKIGSVRTTLPLYKVPYVYLYEECSSESGIEDAIDAAMGADA